MQNVLSSLVLGAALLMPTANMIAQDHHDRMTHEWKDSENETWHRYLKAHHKKDHDWEKATKREQTAYWKWRDQHPDTH